MMKKTARMKKKVNPDPKQFPHKECAESGYDCMECKYEGCPAWGNGYDIIDGEVH